MQATSYRNQLGEIFLSLYAAVYSSLVYLLLSEKNLNGFDPASFFLAAKYGFSLESTRPHAPGYPLFVFLWQRIVSILNTDPHSAIILLNCIFLFLSIIFSYRLIKKYWGDRTACIAILLLTCNPVVLYYSSVAEIYIYDLFMSVFTIYMLLSLRRKYFPIVFFWLGLALGFRFSSVVLLSPVFIASICIREDKKELLNMRLLLSSFALLASGVLLWAYPYYKSPAILLKAISDAESELHSTMYQNVSAFLSYLIWLLHFGIIFIFLKRTKATSHALKKILILWISVPTLFWIFGHYAKGYILLITVPVIVLISVKVSEMNRNLLVGCLVLCNLLLFFLAPFIPPSVESTFPKSHRSSSERLQTALLRTVSFFAPTYSHIKTSDQMMDQSNELLSRNCSEHATIVVDNSAGEFVSPRSLQAIHPSLNFITIGEDSTLLLFAGSEIGSLTKGKLLSTDTIYYLIDPHLRMLRGIPPDARPIEENSLSLYQITSPNKNAFWQYLAKSDAGDDQGNSTIPKSE